MKSAAWRTVDDGLAVRVRVTPKASRNRIDGLVTTAEGDAVVKATVTAVPEAGKANAALIRLLAKAWRVPRSSMSVTGGTTSRLKTVTIRGEPKALCDMLKTWRTTLETGERKEPA